jgi:hypothetical protein
MSKIEEREKRPLCRDCADEDGVCPNRNELCDPTLQDWHVKQLESYKVALADAIRRPMGVVPDSANGLISSKDVALAEVRRVNKAERSAIDETGHQFQ